MINILTRSVGMMFFVLGLSIVTLFSTQNASAQAHTQCWYEPVPSGYVITGTTTDFSKCGRDSFNNIYIIEPVKPAMQICYFSQIPEGYVVVETRTNFSNCQGYSSNIVINPTWYNVLQIKRPLETELVCSNYQIPENYEITESFVLPGFCQSPSLGLQQLGPAAFIRRKYATFNGDGTTAVEAFSLSSNPNGPWSFGYTLAYGSTFHLYPTGIGNPQSVLQFLQPTESFYPFVAWVNAPGPLLWADTVYQTRHVLNLHPGPSGERSVVRFTAPTRGNYLVSAKFSGLDFIGPTSTDVGVQLNSKITLYGSYMNGFGPGPEFEAYQSLSAGDTIDISVGHGGNGFHFDSTGLILSISRQR